MDQFRGSLAGGNLAGYTIEGFGGRMLESLGIKPDDLRNVVAAAQTDNAVAARWRLQHHPCSAA